MSRDSPEGRRIATPIARRVGENANAVQIADATVLIWREIDDALHPVLGRRGMVELYRRSLHLIGAAYPWLAGLPDGDQTAVNLAVLKSGLAQQNRGDATACGEALLLAFRGLLDNLIGDSLTERLLHSVWTNSLRSPPVQDTPP